MVGIGLGGAIVLRTFPVWALGALLWFVLSDEGQAAELLRAAKDDLVRHMFFYGTAALWAGSASLAARLLAAGAAADAGAGVTVTFVRHRVPTTVALGAALAPLAPFYAMPAGAVGAIEPLDNLIRAAAAGAVLAVRFGKGESFHPQLALYAAPAFLSFVVPMPWWVFVVLVFSSLLAFDLWFARRGELYEGPLRTSIAMGMGLLAVSGVIFLAWSPAWASLFLGPLPVLWITASAVVLAIAVGVRAPAWALIVLLAAAGGLIAQGTFGTRAARRIAEQLKLRTWTAEGWAREWLDARRKDIEAAGGAYPVFFITSDGGGIRAAYWTASLLSHLEDLHPGFSDHVFLVSGVSGGSVGAAVYAALVSDKTQAAKLEKAKAILGQDFVAAPLGYLFWRDPWTSIFCLGRLHLWTCPAEMEDRAEVLERVIEGSWRMTTGTQTFAEPFLKLWEGERERRTPALVLNSSQNRTGKRRIVSNLVLDGDAKGLASGLRLSTAAMLSARFPFISPNAELEVDGQLEEWVDGGYADNTGAASAAEALAAFRRAAAGRTDLRLAALILTNDPDLADGHPHYEGEQADCKIRVEPGKAERGGLLSTPISTLDGTRQNVAETYRKEFIGRISEDGHGQTIRLGLFRCEGDYKFPLGWTLSSRVREQIDGKITRIGQSKEFFQIAELMKNK